MISCAHAVHDMFGPFKANRLKPLLYHDERFKLVRSSENGNSLARTQHIRVLQIPDINGGARKSDLPVEHDRTCEIGIALK